MMARSWPQEVLDGILREASAQNRPSGWSEAELREWTGRMIFACQSTAKTDREKR